LYTCGKEEWRREEGEEGGWEREEWEGGWSWGEWGRGEERRREWWLGEVWARVVEELRGERGGGGAVRGVRGVLLARWGVRWEEDVRGTNEVGWGVKGSLRK
jgi:hypothetical protein